MGRKSRRKKSKRRAKSAIQVIVGDPLAVVGSDQEVVHITVDGTLRDQEMNIVTDPSVPRGFVRYRGRLVTGEDAYKEIEKTRRRVARPDLAPPTIADLFPRLKSERPKDGSPAVVAKRAKARKQARRSRRDNRK